MGDTNMSADAVGDVMRWVSDFLMRPDPRLGRRGAVCPFMEQAVAAGRVSYSTVRLETPADVARLRAVAGEGLTHVIGAGAAAGRFESRLFVPVGPDPDLLLDGVLRVQRDLAERAMTLGCMVGEFHPRDTTPGVHAPDFHPLRSPRPLLGMRTMVDTDILFLTQPGIPPERLRFNLDTWEGFFAGAAAPRLVAIARRAREAMPGRAAS